MADPKEPKTPKVAPFPEARPTRSQTQAAALSKAMGGPFDASIREAMERARLDVASVTPTFQSTIEEALRAAGGVDAFRASMGIADALRNAQIRTEVFKSSGVLSAIESLTAGMKLSTPEIGSVFLKSFPVDPVPPSPLEVELESLRQEASEKARALAEKDRSLVATKADAAAKAQRISELEALQTRMHETLRLFFLLHQVHPAARALLESGKASSLAKQLTELRECKAFVLSVDIRRSTELMLKAREPERFALFITELCLELSRIVREDFLGIFDKFTGDGILAFFPTFYSGKDAGYRAVAAAGECHRAFARHYAKSRDVFKSVLLETGLGIGIDYGDVHLARVSGLTVVGAPVVYACRMANAPANETLVNQPAFEALRQRYNAKLLFEERSTDIKSEGKTLAYSVRLNERAPALACAEPSWLKDLPKAK